MALGIRPEQHLRLRDKERNRQKDAADQAGLRPVGVAPLKPPVEPGIAGLKAQGDSLSGAVSALNTETDRRRRVDAMNAYLGTVGSLPWTDGVVPSGMTTGSSANAAFGQSGLNAKARSMGNFLKTNFAGISSIGGYRPHAHDKSGHPAGNAIDVMTRGQNGDAIAAYLLHSVKQGNPHNLDYFIWEQHSYSPRSGWKPNKMRDRGNATQNHYDHLHIQFD